jgi:hypothetical protein
VAFSSSATYVPLKHAAQTYGIPEKTLLERVKSGSIASAQLPNGELLVADHDIDPSLKIKREDFEHLRGQKIGMSSVLKKYGGVPRTTIYNWIKSGFVNVLERGHRIFLDEADIAYCTTIYNLKAKIYDGQMSGVRVFDEDGNPYQIKYPEVAAQLRSERRRARNADEKLKDTD